MEYAAVSDEVGNAAMRTRIRKGCLREEKNNSLIVEH
jgi:hypothetical protein